MARSPARARPFAVGDRVTFVGAGLASFRGRRGRLVGVRRFFGLRVWTVALLDTGEPPKTVRTLAGAFAPAGPEDDAWLQPGARVLGSFNAPGMGWVRAPGTVVEYVPRWFLYRHLWKVRWDFPGRWMRYGHLKAYQLSPLRPLTPDPHADYGFGISHGEGTRVQST